MALIKSMSSRLTLDNGPSFEIDKLFKDSELVFAGRDRTGLDNNECSNMVEILYYLESKTIEWTNTIEDWIIQSHGI